MISIVIPIYNAREHLPKCIESILEQGYSDFELLLINDGSTDNSLEICNKYAEEDKRIKVIAKKNGGVSSARNLGIENATGEHITFIDSDDVLSKDALSLMHKKTTEANANVGSFSMAFFSRTSYKELKLPNTVITSKQQYSSYYKEIDRCLGFNSACAKLFKTDLIKENNICFNEKISILEDGSFVLQCLEKSSVALFDEAVVYNYRQSDGESLISAFHENYIESFEYELSSAKWLIDALDKESREILYAKRFSRLDGFIIKLCRRNDISKKDKISKLKAAFNNEAVKDVLKKQSNKLLDKKRKIKKFLYKNKLVRIILRASR